MGDLGAAVDLFNACSLDTIGVIEETVEETRNEWLSPGFELSSDSRVVLDTNGQLIAYIDVWDAVDPPVHPWVWGRVHPNWRKRGIGSSLMTWAIGRAQQSLSRVPDDARVTMMCYTVRTHESAKRLFESFEMQASRYSWLMVIDLQDELQSPEWPTGISIRNYEHPKDTESVYRLEDDVFKDHWGYVAEPFETGFQRWQHRVIGRAQFDPSLWTLAMEDKEIVGIVRGRPEAEEDPNMGWVSVLGVRRPWRGRGLGLALLLHSFEEFNRQGKTRVGLGVDAENLTGATRLYEKAGMHVSREYVTYQLELRPGRELGTQHLEDA
jgi:mycothiol synthase